jgi:hypothetical protein
LQAAAYARSARRLRAKWKDQPARLHRELRDLPPLSAAKAPAQETASPTGRHAVFAAMAGDSLEGGLLRYSARLRLIAAAARMGIERFEANLIIAAVQNRARPRPSIRASRPAWRSAHWAAALVAVEAVVLLAGAWVWTR